MTIERWLPVPGWPEYAVSDQGRVRSVDRVLADGRTAGGVLLSPWPDRDGYLHVRLSAGERRQQMTVHALVKLAFTGPRRGREVRHRNDDPADNRLSNLRYGTRRQNRADLRRNEERRERGELEGRGEEGKKGEREEGEKGNGRGEIGNRFPSRGACYVAELGGA